MLSATRFATPLVLALSVAAPLTAAAQSRQPATAATAPVARSWPAWPTGTSRAARTSLPLIDTLHMLYREMTGPGWRPAQTQTVEIRDPSQRLNLFCGRQSGPTEINYTYRTPAPSDLVHARFQTVACADRSAAGVTNAVLQYRDGSVWVGQVDIARNRALPEKPVGNRPGAAVMMDGSVLLSRGPAPNQSMLTEDEYRFSLLIHPNGTVIAPAWADSHLLERTRTYYYTSESTRRRSPYRGPPVFFHPPPTWVELTTPDGGRFSGGYFPSAGFYLGRRVEWRDSDPDTSSTVRYVLPITDYTNSEQGYTITGEYAAEATCLPAPGPFAIQYLAPTTEDLPIVDGALAGWACIRFEFIGNVHITTTGASILGPAGRYFAPFGSLAIGRGPRLSDMLVTTQASRIVPVRGAQHGLTPLERRAIPSTYQNRIDGTDADYQATRINEFANAWTGIQQRYDAVLGQVNAPVRGQVVAAREARRRRDQFFFDLAATAAGAAQSYNQQREQQAISDAAYRASVAGYMARDAAARAAMTGGNARDRGAYEDPAARRAEQNRIAAEETAARQQQERAAIAAQALAEERAEAAAVAAQAAQARAAEQAAIAAREASAREAAASPPSASQPSGNPGATTAPLDLYLTVIRAEPSPPQPQASPPPPPPPPPARNTSPPPPPAAPRQPGEGGRARPM